MWPGAILEPSAPHSTPGQARPAMQDGQPAACRPYSRFGRIQSCTPDWRFCCQIARLPCCHSAGQCRLFRTVKWVSRWALLRSSCPADQPHVQSTSCPPTFAAVRPDIFTVRAPHRHLPLPPGRLSQRASHVRGAAEARWRSGKFAWLVQISHDPTLGGCASRERPDKFGHNSQAMRSCWMPWLPRPRR